MELKNKTILVTGGCGLVGSTLVDQLLEAEPTCTVRVIDNLSRGTRVNLARAMATGRVELIVGDIRDFQGIRPHFSDVDAVFHQAAIRITRCAQEPRECLEVLIDGTFNVVQASLEAGVRRLVAASSASVYGMAEIFPTPETHHPYGNRTWYGAAKVMNEGLLRSTFEMHRLDYVALRYFNVYGPRMDVFGKYTEVLIRWLDCIDRGESPQIFGDGRQTMDFVFSEDVARANVLALQSDVTDKVFNVGSGTETSLLQLLETLLKVTGNEQVRPRNLPERNVNPVPRRCADISRAKALLGFEARVSLQEGLRRLVAWRRQVVERGESWIYDGTVCCQAAPALEVMG